MANTQQWVIRVDTEQVKGPYSTDALIKMIYSGVFSGNEEVCKYPDGTWAQLTKQPEFYDALIESLENPVEVDIKKAQKMEAETVVRPMPQRPKKTEKVQLPEAIRKIMEEEEREEQRLLQNQSEKDSDVSVVDSRTKSSLVLAKLNIQSMARKLPGLKAQQQQQKQDKQFTIQMADIQTLKTNEQKKFLPILIILLIIIGVIFYFLNSEPEKKSSGWRLAAPAKSEEPISAEMNLAYKRKLVRAFQMGRTEDILSAHRGLALIVGSGARDLEAMGLLCVAYNQLWPFTNQTPEDFRSITLVTQLARGINPISNYSETCQVVFLLAKGQSKEAQSLLEKTLDVQVDDRFTLGPFLYFIKAEMLEAEYSYLNATAYFEQASQLWPQWVLSRVGAGKVLLKSEKFAEAQAQFSAALKQNLESKAALYGLGLVEYKGNKNKEKALEFFARGYAIQGAINKELHADALWAYAIILEEKQQLRKALEVAEKGYHINPSHKQLKNLVVVLGGNEQIDNNQNEVVLLGDQFARAGDHLAAQAHYKSAFDINPQNSAAAYKAAKSLWHINQTKEAIKWLEKAIKADPKLIQAYVLKADYEAQKYNFSEATRLLLDAAKKSPQNHEVLKGQALLEFRKNNITGTIQYGERALKIYDADVELLSLLAQAYTTYYQNAPATKSEDIARKDEAMKSAMRLSGRAIDLEPSWPEGQITRAKVLGAKDGPVRGEKFLQDKIKEYPYTIEYRLALGDYYRSIEKFTAASEVFLQVYQLDPKNKKAAFGLAECYRILNNPDEAQRYYNFTSLLDPSDVEPMFANAKLLIETASGREAQAKLKQSIAKLDVVKNINPNFPRVSYLMAKAYMELGDFDKALSLIKEEKSKNPNLADPFLLAAEVFYRKEQFKDCAAEYSTAIKMRPSSAELYIKASVCYRKSDAVEIAQDMLDIARQKESGYIELYREQGYIYEKMGLASEARAEFEKYLELAPNAPDKLIIQDKVK